ncbi:hypothetical protein BDZ90DRAFT_193931 [Jaminaea rosea]|uniref:Sfi1 spindle body domain-containing protein n=1 Tax=Jaminaea rosea TaxID=1569628 RepID=A0A316USL7_9BASI|nr:hypothetical protein BDZ90DRAFT_193931 [Jaminaea rosea]PWN26873.1 hypothetical protein BDZ90DRAFT_193931 [Jaminaea rosea]
MAYNGYRDVITESDSFHTSDTESDLSEVAHLATSHGPALSTTSGGSSSARSITSTFSALDAEDIHFFDELISSLALGDGSFASLKRAYEALRPQDEERDAHRWDLLLSLVRVQGRDWSERWDAVRLSLGMDMRGGDNTAAMDSETTMESDADTVGPAGSDAATITGQWTQEESQSEGSDADQSSDEQEEKETWASGPSTPRNSSQQAASALRARLDVLTQQASQLALDARTPSRPRINGSVALLLDSPSAESPSSSDQDRATQTLAQRRMSAVLSNREPLRAAAQRRAEEGEEVAWSRSNRLAQQHFERRLLAVSLGWWAGQAEERRARMQRVGMARDNLVVGRAWHQWKSLSVDPNDAHCQMALRADEVRLLLTPWRAWRRRVADRREKRWEERKIGLKECYVVVKEGKEQRETRQAWGAWREALADRRSANFRNGHLLGGAFYLWRIKQGVSEQLGGLLRQWNEAHPPERDGERLREIWELWRKRTSLEGTSRAYERLCVQRRALGSWLQAVAEASMKKRRMAQAERQQARATLRAALGQWKRARSSVRQREAKAIAFRQGQDAGLAAQAVQHWKLSSRLSLWSRVREGRQQMAALQAWRSRLQDVTVVLPQRSQALVARRNAFTVSAYFTRWLRALSSHKEDSSLATSHLHQRTRLAFFAQWRKATQSHTLNTERALAARDWFQQRTAFDTLRSRLRNVKRQRLEVQHDNRLIARVLATWRQRSAQQALDRLRVSQVQSRLDEGRTRAALSRWTAAVIERRALVLQVAEVRDERLASLALRKWVTQARRVAELNSLAQSSLDVKRHESARRVLHEWARRYRKHRLVRERGEEAVRDREVGLLRGALERWEDAWRDSSLRENEMAVLQLRQRRVMGQALGKWVERTKPIPALHFHGMRLKIAALRKWKEALPLALDRRRADEAYEGSTLRKAMAFWCEKAKARRGARAAERFGGQAVGKRLRRHSARVTGVRSPFVVRPGRRSLGPSEEGVVEEQRSGSRMAESPRLIANQSPTPSSRSSLHRLRQPPRPASSSSSSSSARRFRPQEDDGEEADPPATLPTFSSTSSTSHDKDRAGLYRSALTGRARSEILRPSSLPPSAPSAISTIAAEEDDDAATRTPLGAARRSRPLSVRSEAGTTTPRATAWAKAMKSAVAASGTPTSAGSARRRGKAGQDEGDRGGEGSAMRRRRGSMDFLEELRRRRREMR